MEGNVLNKSYHYLFSPSDSLKFISNGPTPKFVSKSATQRARNPLGADKIDTFINFPSINRMCGRIMARDLPKIESKGLESIEEFPSYFMWRTAVSLYDNCLTWFQEKFQLISVGVVIIINFI